MFHHRVLCKSAKYFDPLTIDRDSIYHDSPNFATPYVIVILDAIHYSEYFIVSYDHSVSDAISTMDHKQPQIQG